MYYIPRVCACSLSCPACNAHVPYHIAYPAVPFFPRYLNIKETCVTKSWNSLSECQNLLLLNEIISISVGIHLGFIVINEPSHPHSNKRRGGGSHSLLQRRELLP